MKDKVKTASIRPSPLASKITIVMLILFLIFGVSLMSETPDDPAFTFFRVVWVAACIGGIIYSIRNLSTYSEEQKKKIPGTADEVVGILSEEENEEKDFESKLRKLESLRKDKLITEEEYQKKRKEIMAEKW